MVAGAGLLLAWFLTRAPELRFLRLAQFIFLPISFVAALAVLPEPSGHASVEDIGAFVMFLGIMGFIIILIVPNVSHLLGAAVCDLLETNDWSSENEEITLKPVQRLIDKDRYQDAFEELEALLKQYKPSFNALLLKAKLLNQFQRYNEVEAALLQMLRLSGTARQQLTVIELLASLEAHQKGVLERPEPGRRPWRINRPLVLVKTGSADFSDYKEIPAGEYAVEEAANGRRCWLVLPGEPWGNAKACWEAVRETGRMRSAVKKGFFYHVARTQGRLAQAIRGKSWRQARADSRATQAEADRFIRAGNWTSAMPLLQKASDDAPDNYEIAYRLVQAARLTSVHPDSDAVLKKVLTQSRWTEDQERMLKQL